MHAINPANRIRLLRSKVASMLTSRLDKRAQIENRVVSAIVLSPTDAVSQEAMVGSAQRVVVARARAPRDEAFQHCLEYLDSEHPDFELEGNARSVVQFEGLLPEASPCAAYASIDHLDGQVSIIGVDVPPEVYELVRLVVRLARASTLDVAVDSSFPFLREHVTLVLASDTVSPNAAHMNVV